VTTFRPELIFVVFRSSKYRALRHTCTIAACTILEGLATSLGKLHTNHDIVKRQLESEQGKSSKSVSKITQLQSNMDTLEANEEILEHIIAFLFKAIVGKRYKDTLPELRATAIVTLGECIIRCPGYFLEPIDQHIKYLGWTLNDSDASVRLATLEALIKLYKDDEITDKVNMFSRRFMKRYKEMSSDIDAGVTVKAIEVLGMLQKDFAENPLEVEEGGDTTEMDADEMQEVFKLVLAKDKNMQMAAGVFMVNNYLNKGESSPKKTPKGKTPKGKSPKKSDDSLQLKRLVAFNEILCDASGMAKEVTAQKVVETLWELKQGGSEVVKDLAGMMVMLLDDDDLKDQEQAHLAAVISAAMKISSDIRATLTKKKNSAKDKKEAAIKTHDEATRAVMQTLPQLLMKFKADTAILEALLAVPDNMNLDLFTADNRSKKTVLELVDISTEIMLKTASKPVILAVSSVLNKVQKCEGDLVTTLETKLGGVAQDLYKAIHAGLDKAVKGKTPTKKQDSAADTLLLNMVRCQCLAMPVEPELSDIEGIVSKTFSAFSRKVSVVTGEVASETLRLFWEAIAWHVSLHVEKSASATSPSSILEHVNTLMDQCSEMLTASDTALRTQCFKIIADTLCLLNAQGEIVQTEPELMYQCNGSMQDKLSTYFEEELHNIQGDSENPDEDIKKLMAPIFNLALFGSVQDPFKLTSKILQVGTEINSKCLRNSIQTFIQFMLTNKDIKSTVAPVVLNAVMKKYEKSLDHDGSITDDACEEVAELSKYLSSRLNTEKASRDGSVRFEKASKVAFEVVKSGIERAFKDDGDESWMPFLECGLVGFLDAMTLKATETVGELLLELSPPSAELKMLKWSAFNNLLNAVNSSHKKTAKKRSAQADLSDSEDSEEEEEEEESPQKRAETTDSRRNAAAEPEDMDEDDAVEGEHMDVEDVAEEDAEEEEEEEEEMSQAPPPKAKRYR